MSAAETESGSPYDLTIERVIGAPPKLVWRCWTEAEHLAKWWAPAPLTTAVLAFDPRPGGAFKTLMTAPDGAEYPANGVFLDLVERKRIVFTDTLEPGWRPAQEPFFTAIITLAPHDGGTRYVARALHKNQEDRKRHEEMGFFEGWDTCLNQLARLAEQMEANPS